MKDRLKNSGRAASIPMGMLTAAAVSIILTVLISTIGAILISKEVLAQEGIGIWSMLTLVTGTLAGGITAAGRIKRRRLQMSLIHGGIYYLILLSMTVLFFGGEYSGMGTVFITVTVSALVAGVLSSGGWGKRKSGIRKKSHR